MEQNASIVANTRPADLRQATIAALSEAVEFLSCAIRAAAYGADLKGDDVRKPVEWAVAKVKEAGG